MPGVPTSAQHPLKQSYWQEGTERAAGEMSILLQTDALSSKQSNTPIYSKSLIQCFYEDYLFEEIHHFLKSSLDHVY